MHTLIKFTNWKSVSDTISHTNFNELGLNLFDSNRKICADLKVKCFLHGLVNVTEVSQAPLVCGSDLPRTRRDFLLWQQATFRDHVSKAHCTDTMVKCTLFSTTVMKKPINQQSIPVLWNKTEHKNLEC